MSCLKFKIARDVSYIYTVETTQIIFVAVEMLFCGEMVILRTLLRICGAGARVRINVQTDCHIWPGMCTIIPTPARAFDGTLARAPGILLMLNSDLYVSQQYYNVTLHQYMQYIHLL